ncbi:hypothetical protein [Novosphingobium panipatense]|uniref:hypothetical protein n=1 Tax=Novosphingobium panipatense TaxID=428991 RepID=UPI00361B0C80
MRQVVEWHPAVTEAVGRLNAREQQIAVAEAGYLPQIEGGIGTGYNNIGEPAGDPEPTFPHRR